MASPIPPIPPIRALWRKQCPEEARERTAEAMAQAPRAALTQVAGLLMHINNGNSAHCPGPAGGTALAAETQLEKFVERGLGGTPLSRDEFIRVLVHVGQLEQDVRRRLSTPGCEETVRENQKILDQSVRLLRFMPPETD